MISTGQRRRQSAPSPRGRRSSPPCVRLVALLAAVAAALALSGCVSVPISGNVERVQASGQPSNPTLEIAPVPPLLGASPELIANGFISAMAAYQPGWQVAKQYLTPAAAARWKPDQQVLIYTENAPLNATPTAAVLEARLSGALAADGAYSYRNAPLTYNFGMVKDAGGQWRISRPPAGLLVSLTNFNLFYQVYSRYFYEPQYRSLVPDPIYLPVAANPAAALVRSLLDGPTAWLAPAVRTAIPAGTTLNGQSVPVDHNGIADVSLSDAVLSLNEQARSQMAAQVTWTLGSVTGVAGVRFTVNGTPFQITRDQVGTGTDAYVQVDKPDNAAPVDVSTTSGLFAATKDGVVTVDDQGRSHPLPGDLGSKTPGIDALAVSAESATVAAVTDGGTKLRVGQAANAPVRTVLSDKGTLLRPQFTRFNELWTISRDGARQRLWLIRDGKAVEVPAPALGSAPVQAFRISPDGVRMALVRRVGNRSELGIARLTRGDTTVTLDGWRSVSLVDSDDQVTQVADVGWFEPTVLLILGSAGPTVPPSPYSVRQDASERSLVGQSDHWSAAALATSPSSGKAVVLGRGGGTWQYQEKYSWPSFGVDKLRAIAYPG